MPTEIGHSSSCPTRYTSGARKSFHAKKKWNRQTAVMAGQACGTITESSVRNGPAPSIMAASSISRGMLMKNCRSRNTLYALPKKCGTSSGSHVPTQPSLVNSAYVGTIVTCCGRMIVPTRMVNSSALPGIRNRENPYATTTAELTAPTVPINAMATVLKNSRPKFVICQASTKLDQCGLNIHTRSSVRQRPCHSRGCVGSFGSTNVLCSRPFLTSAS